MCNEKKRKNLKILTIIMVSTIALFGITNIQLAQKSDRLTDGFKSSTSDMIMILIDANHNKTIRKIKSKVLEGKDGDMSLMEFLTPADVKGTKMLTYEHINKDDDQWMYLPALKRVKRISSRNKSGSFMGSEFSYEDTANSSWEKYNYAEKLEKVQLDGKQYYKGIRYPKDKNSGYSKQITYIGVKDFLVYKVEYYDRKKELLKTAIFSGWKKLDGVYINSEIVMTNHQNSKKTILQWDNKKIKLNLNKRDFSKRKLKL